MPQKVTRLYTQFQPNNYQLYLDLDRENMNFTGKVTITGKKVSRPSQRITLHSKDLRIIGASIIKKDKTGPVNIAVDRINLQKSYDEVRLHTKEQLYPGIYEITLEFAAAITKPMNGIYPCFFEQGGQDKVLLATQFESHHAREAFPCIDEPEAKATFDLTLKTPSNETVIANTPVKTQSAGLTSFETTPQMSTYLLAFVCGELDYLEAKTKDGVIVRTYATADNVKHTAFALDVAVKCLEFYNEYFDIAYPLPKCDFIALPDFASGAMENWGCITFREQSMLVDPKNTSLPSKQYVANVVAHELTHQWFGNLVTMRWWNDLWLNESFASWMSYLAVDKLFPEWDVWTQFIVDEQSVALKLDALLSTHPIEVEINHPDEIRTIFDAISYEKGASVLNMLKNYLGDTAFRDGLRKYLKANAYKNAETKDLWASLEEVSGKPVSSFMSAWTNRPGYPIVKVTATDNKLTIDQERFYLLNDDRQANQESVWPIPLLPSSPLAIETTDKKSTTCPWPKDLSIINHERTGFYRTVYDEAGITKLGDLIKLGKVSTIDRLSILADALEASKAGYGSAAGALKLLESYTKETDSFVWDVITGVLASIRTVMRDDDLREAMKPLGRKLVATELARLGWDAKDDDTTFDILLRPTILSLASASDEQSVVDEAKRRFAAMDNPEDTDPDIRGVIYGTIAREGGQAEFERLLKMHNGSKNSEERVTLAAALTSFKQPELIQKALDLITSKEVRLQDTTYWIAYSFMNRHARDTTWEWMVANWKWLEANMGDDLGFYRMPNYAARNYSDRSFLPTFTEFFDNNLGPAFERPVQQAIETIKWQSDWKSRDLSAIKAYFKAD